MNWYLKALKQYADFGGRARRKEYWMFMFFNIIFAVVALILDNVLGIAMKGYGYGLIYVIFSLVMLIPSLSITVRRLHDVGKSGWIILIGIIPVIGGIWLLVLMLTDSNSGDNEYGHNPKPITSEMIDVKFKDLIKKPIVINTGLIIISYLFIPYFNLNLGTWGNYSKSGIGLFFTFIDEFDFINSISFSILAAGIYLLFSVYQRNKKMINPMKLVILAMHVILFIYIAFLADKASIKFVGFGLWLSLILSIALFFDDKIEGLVCKNKTQEPQE